MTEKQDKKAELLKAVKEITDKLNERELKPAEYKSLCEKFQRILILK